MGPPAVAVAGPVLVMPRSVEAVVTTLTSVLAEAELSAGFGSASLPLIVAVFMTLPAVAGAVALIVIVAAAVAREPTSQVTVAEALVQVPCEEVAETKPTPAGRVSLSLPTLRASGLLLVAVRV